jgi:hypothetical protein
MKMIGNMTEARAEGPLVMAMIESLIKQYPAELEREEGFDFVFGGNVYVLEEGDDPRNVNLQGIKNIVSEIDMLDGAWRVEGATCLFWATNNSGGPTLIIPDGIGTDELREAAEKAVGR